MGQESETTPMLESKQLEYLEWLVTPPSERMPRTQLEMAKVLAVDPKTLRRWEKKPVFKKEWDRRVSEIQGSPERTQRLLDSLYAKALSGDNRAAQLYLQATNRLVPQAPVNDSAKSLSDLSDDELDKIISAIAAKEASKRANLRAL